MYEDLWYHGQKVKTIGFEFEDVRSSLAESGRVAPCFFTYFTYSLFY